MSFEPVAANPGWPLILWNAHQRVLRLADPLEKEYHGVWGGILMLCLAMHASFISNCQYLASGSLLSADWTTHFGYGVEFHTVLVTELKRRDNLTSSSERREADQQIRQRLLFLAQTESAVRNHPSKPNYPFIYGISCFGVNFRLYSCTYGDDAEVFPPLTDFIAEDAWADDAMSRSGMNKLCRLFDHIVAMTQGARREELPVT